MIVQSQTAKEAWKETSISRDLAGDSAIGATFEQQGKQALNHARLQYQEVLLPPFLGSSSGSEFQSMKLALATPFAACHGRYIRPSPKTIS